MSLSKCVGCGYCCIKATCIVGRRIHGDKTPCPELMFEKGRYWCRWVMSQELVSENAGIVAAKALNIDAGCCCGLNTWRHDVKDRCVGPNAQTTVEEILRVIYRG